MEPMELEARVADLEDALQAVVELFNPQTYIFEGDQGDYEDIVQDAESVLLDVDMDFYGSGEDEQC